MKAIALTKAGYNDNLIMYEDGSILNAETQKFLKEDEHERVTIY